MKRLATLLAVGAATLVLPVANAAAKDYADTALNIIPSGQWGAIPPPDASGNFLPADRQAEMYDGLTPLFDNVTDGDLTTYFKSAALGSLGTDGPGTPEVIPGHPEIQITRDIYNVPHVVSSTHEGGVFAAGWIAAEDRGLVLQQARYNGRVAAIDAPGLKAIDLIRGLQNFQPSEQTEAELAKQTDALLAYGREGRKALADIDTYIEGIDAFYANQPGADPPPFTRNDIYAINAVKAQFLGQGGGDEARRTQFLSGLQDRVGARKGKSIFNDLRQFKVKGSPVAVDGRFPYGKLPKNPKGNVIIDHDSFSATPAVAERVAERYASEPTQASNTLMITKKKSATGKPLMVGGPQIGFNYPGLTYEIDMQAPGLVWRGATSALFPGYMLIGRGEDFATTLTSASGDIIDQYAEKLCGGSDTKYVYKGKCREMGSFDAGTLGGDPVTFRTTVHGPVVGYATVKGKKVAISSKRSSYGQDVVDILFNRRLSNGYVKSPKTFFKAASKTPQTFNSFYIDNKHVASFTSGKLPIRPDGVDPGLLTNGNGKYEWEGFLGRKGHVQGTDPKDGTMTNWNNGAGHGFGAADNEWGRNGAVGRVDLLDKNLARLAKKGKWTMAAVVSAMNASATQDVRAIDTVPLLRKLLKGSEAPSPRAQQMLDLMVSWRNNGANRLDLDGDGLIDNPGAAVMDGAWPNIGDSFMQPRIGPQLDELRSLFSRWDAPPTGQYSGWYQYFDRDIKGLLGIKQPAGFENSYCGKGKLKACQAAIWNAIEVSGTEIAAEQGSEDPAAWRSSATDEEIRFSPINVKTMAYTNRPSGIQQVISFKGHRPKKKK